MRAAIYARYSSDLQRDTSLEDQIAVARRHATERSWTVLKDHIYTDAGISCASIQNRPSVQRLLAAAGQRPKAFDVVLVDDSSRIRPRHSRRHSRDAATQVPGRPDG